MGDEEKVANITKRIVLIDMTIFIINAMIIIYIYFFKIKAGGFTFDNFVQNNMVPSFLIVLFTIPVMIPLTRQSFLNLLYEILDILNDEENGISDFFDDARIRLKIIFTTIISSSIIIYIVTRFLLFGGFFTINVFIRETLFAIFIITILYMVINSIIVKL